MITTEDIRDALRTMAIVAETIRDAGSIPSGVLYAGLMDKMNLSAYDAMIRQIKRTGLVSEQNNVLTWRG